MSADLFTKVRATIGADEGMSAAAQHACDEARAALDSIEEQLEACERVVEEARVIRQLEETGTWPDFQPLADALDALNPARSPS